MSARQRATSGMSASGSSALFAGGLGSALDVSGSSTQQPAQVGSQHKVGNDLTHRTGGGGDAQVLGVCSSTKRCGRW